jgi:hypothetical protein
MFLVESIEDACMLFRKRENDLGDWDSVTA